jgi:hypothetical protein
MSVTDVGVVLSFLAIVVVVAKMLRAFRLLEARVTLLQEQIERSHGAAQKAIQKSAASTMSAPRPPVRTPVLGVPVTATTSTPRPPTATTAPSPSRNDGGAEPSDDEIAWEWLQQEQKRLKDAMGRDFQARKKPTAPTSIGGSTSPRMLSARDVAAKLERR